MVVLCVLSYYSKGRVMKSIYKEMDRDAKKVLRAMADALDALGCHVDEHHDECPVANAILDLADNCHAMADAPILAYAIAVRAADADEYVAAINKEFP